MKSVSCEPHWPNLQAYFERAAKESRGAKRKQFQEQADSIKAYLSANPACPGCGAVKQCVCSEREAAS